MKMSSLPHHGNITWGVFFPLHPQNPFCCLTAVYSVLSMCQEIVCRAGCIEYQLLCSFSASLSHWPLLRQQFCGFHPLTRCNLTSPSFGPTGNTTCFPAWSFSDVGCSHNYRGKGKLMPMEPLLTKDGWKKPHFPCSCWEDIFKNIL